MISPLFSSRWKKGAALLSSGVATGVPLAAERAGDEGLGGGSRLLQLNLRQTGAEVKSEIGLNAAKKRTADDVERTY